jgi:hypothetical protein
MKHPESGMTGFSALFVQCDAGPPSITSGAVTRSKFSFADTAAREVVGVSKATGSSDADVLYAAKEEYGSTFAAQHFQGLGLLIVSALSSVTIVLVIIGVPVAIFGWRFWQKGKRNIAIVEGAYADYLASTRTAAAPLAS